MQMSLKMSVETVFQHEYALKKWASSKAVQNPQYGMLLEFDGDIPSFFLAAPKKAMGGLWIVLNLPSGETTECPEQKEWISKLVWAGYQAEDCHGWEHAKQTIERYLS